MSLSCVRGVDEKFRRDDGLCDLCEMEMQPGPSIDVLGLYQNC